MDTPSLELPQPKIKEPLSFRPVKRAEEDKNRKQYLDSTISKSFLKAYFKKKKIKK